LTGPDLFSVIGICLTGPDLFSVIGICLTSICLS
jgi:hypothetical protein